MTTVSSTRVDALRDVARTAEACYNRSFGVGYALTEMWLYVYMPYTDDGRSDPVVRDYIADMLDGIGAVYEDGGHYFRIDLEKGESVELDDLDDADKSI